MIQEFKIGDRVRLADWPLDDTPRTIREIRKTITPHGWFCIVDFEEKGVGTGIVDSSGFTNMIKIEIDEQ